MAILMMEKKVCDNILHTDTYLHLQFAERYAPLYERRQAIIAGKVEPTDAEVEAGKAVDDSDDEDEEANIEEVNEDNDEEAKGIPGFWLTALQNHVPIAETITDNDEEALKSLENISLSYLEDGQPGFKLHFTFGPNDFFENTELTKTYYYQVSFDFSKQG